MSFYKEVPGRKTTLESTLKFDTAPTAGSTNPVTSDGIATAITEAVGDASDAIQEQIDDIAEKAGSGYTPKGPASVATLNGLTGQENGWLYTMTDAGTLTDGSLAVTAGDTVAWDATNSVWYKAMDYATKAYADYKFSELVKGQTEYLPFERYIANDYTWQNAKYNVGTQQIVTDSKRAITNESKFMAENTEIIFDLTGLDYQYTILGFDGQGNRLFGGGSWVTASTFVVPRDCYIKIQLRHSNDATFSLTGFDASFISFKFVAKFGVDNLSDDVVAKLNELVLNVVDLFLFAGQSNMAGRGATSEAHPESAPTILTGAGYEYRAISDPTKLYPIAEPFGVNENKTGGISEPGAKTGSMVTSFVNAYYSATKTTVIGVSASKGGTKISEWKSNGVLLPDALQRLADAVSFLTSKGYTIRHKYVLWCQGESDGDYLTNVSDYKSDFDSVLTSFKNAGIEKMFIVRIGRINSGDHTRYDYIIDAQTEICQENKDVVMASTDFYSMQARGLMKDTFHYYQEGYNEVGNYAGANVGAYVALGGKEQTMFDPKSNNLYFTHKN